MHLVKEGLGTAQADEVSVLCNVGDIVVLNGFLGDLLDHFQGLFIASEGHTFYLYFILELNHSGKLAPYLLNKAGVYLSLLSSSTKIDQNQINPQDHQK